jgi:hypothetical protein
MVLKNKNTGQLLKVRGRKVRLGRRGKSLRSNNSSTLFGSKDTKLLGKLVRGGRDLLLEEQRKQIQNDLRSVKGSLAIEGLILTKEEERLVISNALGQISDEEFDKRVMDLINND